MSGGKCVQCGLVNWPDAAACGRCGATLAAAATPAAESAAGPGRPRRGSSKKWQVVRSLTWGAILYVGLVSLCFALIGLYDRATGAPPPPTGAPHNFPANPFFYVAVLVIYSAPVTCAVIALLLYRQFGRREAARRARQ